MPKSIGRDYPFQKVGNAQVVWMGITHHSEVGIPGFCEMGKLDLHDLGNTHIVAMGRPEVNFVGLSHVVSGDSEPN